ncbi:MAG TPA: DedA family protein [Stellaceae bacterium]|nr:DedA family protein [Stellaceae bacterium]
MSGFGAVQPYLHEYGYLAVSAGMLLENAGLPLPGETLLIAASLLADRGVFDIARLLPLAWAAATIGNIVGFAIGRYGGHALVVHYGARIGITAKRLAQVEKGFDRYGAWLLTAARFVVVARSLGGIAAGTLEMAWGRFLVFNALGAALWVGWWGLLAYWLGQRLLYFVHGIGGIEPLLLATGALAAAAVALYLHWRRRLRRAGAPAEPPISVP